MPGPVPPVGGSRFVGRSGELAVLRAAFGETLTGESRLVLVAGEAGIGKTALARVFARLARDDGAVVLWGSAWQDGGAPPYWPWVQVLRSWRRQSKANAPGELAGQDAVLGQILPELGVVRGPAGSAEGARFALFEAVCTVLDGASRSAPLVVVIDDVHAAGRTSALLLRFAAAAPLSRVLLIAAYRAAEARLDDDLGDVISALETTGTLLTLSGLPPEEIQAMLPGAGAGLVADVARRSDGNPLFVSQIARLLGQDAATVEEVPVPAGIRQAIRHQVARLPGTRPSGSEGRSDQNAGTRQILATAAAVGPEPDPALVAEALGVAAEPVAEVFDQAAAAGLLRAGPGPGGGYRFGHDLIRETLYSELAPQARARTHRRIAEALDKEPRRSRTGHAELAFHYLRAASVSGAAVASAVGYARLAGEDALSALAYEEAAGYFRQALDALGRAPESTPARRCELQLRLAAALTKLGPNPTAEQVIDEAARLARQAGRPPLLARAALLSAQYLDFNAPADPVIALLREAAEMLGPGDCALRARTLARLAMALATDRAAASAAADQAVDSARQAVASAARAGQQTSGDRTGRAGRDADDREAAAALAAALAARQHVLWGTQDPREALAGASQIAQAAQRAQEPDAELDARVLCLTHLLELGDGPACQRVLPDLDRLAELLRQPAARLVALSRRSTMAAVTGDFPQAARLARQAWEIGQASGLPDADAVYWGQLFAIWLHTDLPDGHGRQMEHILRKLVARSHLWVAHAAVLVQIDAARGATEQASGRLDELVSTGMDSLRPDMVHVWALAQLAQACCRLRESRYARRLYQALAPYAGRAAVAAGAVMCAGSTDFYLGGLAALSGDLEPADRHYRAAIGCHRRLGARPMLARSLHEHSLLLRQRAHPDDLPAASTALAESRAIAAECGMTKLLAVLDAQHAEAPGPLALSREDDYWLITCARQSARLPDSLGLRYLDLLVRNPGRELAALELVQLTGATGTATAGAQASGLHGVTDAPADDILDPQARAAYRQRLTELDQELAEAEQWNDPERASRLRTEKDFLVHELLAATGLGGRPRQLGSESERARINVTRAIRSAISRIRDRAPAAAAHLDQAIRTGSRCSYTQTRTSTSSG